MLAVGTTATDQLVAKRGRTSNVQCMSFIKHMQKGSDVNPMKLMVLIQHKVNFGTVSHPPPLFSTPKEDGIALVFAKRREVRAYPEFSGPPRRARLVVLEGEVAGKWSKETLTFLSSVKTVRF